MKILIIGCGNMGGAMLAGWLAAGLAPAEFTVLDPQIAQVSASVALHRDPAELLGQGFDAVLLGIKPQQLAEAAPLIAPLADGAVLLSILAGVDLATLRRRFPAAAAHVRVMPNLAAALGKSPIGLAGDPDDRARALVDRLMAPLGQPEWLSGEDRMDLVTALAGSGPAFVYRMIDALAAGAAELGLPREQADRLALSMVEGAAALAAGSPCGPGELADRVASPGGTTRAGLDVLDTGGRLAALMTETLRAARDRSAEMTEQARAG